MALIKLEHGFDLANRLHQTEIIKYRFMVLVRPLSDSTEVECEGRAFARPPSRGCPVTVRATVREPLRNLNGKSESSSINICEFTKSDLSDSAFPWCELSDSAWRPSPHTVCGVEPRAGPQVRRDSEARNDGVCSSDLVASATIFASESSKQSSENL
jgi:hypothetical protein